MGHVARAPRGAPSELRMLQAPGAGTPAVLKVVKWVKVPPIELTCLYTSSRSRFEIIIISQKMSEGRLQQ